MKKYILYKTFTFMLNSERERGRKGELIANYMNSHKACSTAGPRWKFCCKSSQDRERVDTYNIILNGCPTQRTRLGRADVVHFLEATFAERVLAWDAHSVTLALQADGTKVLRIVHWMWVELVWNLNLKLYYTLVLRKYLYVLQKIIESIYI